MAIKKIGDNKLFHMRAVAELMYERAFEKTGDEEYAEDMYVVGLLHDIGYIFGSSEHGASGAALMARNGYSHCPAIRWHGKFDIPEEELTDEVLLMQWCDMSVRPGGKVVSCAERLEDIGERYGLDSKEYLTCRDICRRLAEHGMY